MKIPTLDDSKKLSTLLANNTMVIGTQLSSKSFYYVDLIPAVDRYLVIELDLSYTTVPQNYGYFLMANTITLPWVSEKKSKIFVSGEYKGIFSP